MSGKIRIGINAFVCTGRTLFRLLLDHPKIRVVAVNNLADAYTPAHLLKYNSIQGVLQRSVSATDAPIRVDDFYNWSEFCKDH